MSSNETCLESYLLIDCNNFNNRLARAIKNIDKVEDVEITSGAFDIVTKIKTKNYSELQKLMSGDLRKIIDKRSTLILMKKEKGIEITSPNEFDKVHDNFTDCEFCGLTLSHCHCECPYCGERDNCTCVCGDAATGG